MVFIKLGQCPHNAKIKSNILTKSLGLDRDIDIARVHVRVKKTIAKNLAEKNLYPLACQLGQIDTRIYQGLGLAHLHPVHALHSKNIRGAKIGRASCRERQEEERD